MLKYEQANQDRYTYAFWIVAGSPGKVLAGIQKVLDLLGLPERAQSERHVKEEAFKFWLANAENWLLMFDKVTEDDYAMILNILPSSHNGCILFTSQRPGAVIALTGTLGNNCLELKVPDEDDAVVLFLALSEVEETSESRRLAVEIVNEIGQLPHAIEQSASYRLEMGMDLTEHLARLRSDKDCVIHGILSILLTELNFNRSLPGKKILHPIENQWRIPSGSFYKLLREITPLLQICYGSLPISNPSVFHSFNLGVGMITTNCFHPRL